MHRLLPALLALGLAAFVPLGSLHARPADPDDLIAARGPARAAQPAPVPLLATHRIVSLYGTPLAPGLGSLGEQGPAATVARARAQADAYTALSDDRTVLPALHLIYATAQASPGADGLYLQRLGDDLIAEYVALTRDNGMLLFLDIQMGRSTVERELGLIAGWLAEGHVHVALDPEFAWGPGRTPVESIGALSAGQINTAQALLAAGAQANGLPGKILIIHQFRLDMVTDKAQIVADPWVELVFDMDGFGSPAAKLATWQVVIQGSPVGLPGIKLFYDYDQPLLTPAEVLAFEPRPLVIIYQ